eukprot:GHVS01099355.1.p3 GENE.GHVS01099355.1~~GHVS01099355.1.p3  ORF type:complete len:132 (-),score=12.63 GHVS01099355.1:460-855(-)
MNVDSLCELFQRKLKMTDQNGEPRAMGAAHEENYMTAEAERFPSVPSEDAKQEQEKRKDGIFAACKLSNFEPHNEELLEDWIDEAARMVYRHRLHPQLFQELWESRCRRRCIEAGYSFLQATQGDTAFTCM